MRTDKIVMYNTKEAIGDIEKIGAAYDMLNGLIFGGALPPVYFTLQMSKKSNGHFAPSKFTKREKKGGVALSELSLNPEVFLARSDIAILSTLCHEMVHVWQHTYGKPSRNGYHNREWANKMELIGLMPSDTGEDGGARTGQKMTHYIIPGGRFEIVANDFLKNNGFVSWGAHPGVKAKPKSGTRSKYQCGCGVSIWGKEGLSVNCGACGNSFMEV